MVMDGKRGIVWENPSHKNKKPLSPKGCRQVCTCAVDQCVGYLEVGSISRWFCINVLNLHLQGSCPPYVKVKAPAENLLLHTTWEPKDLLSPTKAVFVNLTALLLVSIPLIFMCDQSASITRTELYYNLHQVSG